MGQISTERKEEEGRIEREGRMEKERKKERESNWLDAQLFLEHFLLRIKAYAWTLPFVYHSLPPLSIFSLFLLLYLFLPLFFLLLFFLPLFFFSSSSSSLSLQLSSFLNHFFPRSDFYFLLSSWWWKLMTFATFLSFSSILSIFLQRKREERKKWKSATSVPRGSSICKTRIFLSERMKVKERKRKKKEEKERIEIHFSPARQKSRGGIIIFY